MHVRRGPGIVEPGRRSVVEGRGREPLGEGARGDGVIGEFGEFHWQHPILASGVLMDG